jgi:hypothetical protein
MRQDARPVNPRMASRFAPTTSGPAHPGTRVASLRSDARPTTARALLADFDCARVRREDRLERWTGRAPTEGSPRGTLGP